MGLLHLLYLLPRTRRRRRRTGRPGVLLKPVAVLVYGTVVLLVGLCQVGAWLATSLIGRTSEPSRQMIRRVDARCAALFRQLMATPTREWIRRR